MTATRLPWQACLLGIRHSDIWDLYLRRTRRWPHLFFPRTHNENMQWRKLFDHAPRIPPLSERSPLPDDPDRASAARSAVIDTAATPVLRWCEDPTVLAACGDVTGLAVLKAP